MVAIGVESTTAPAVAGCQGDREPKAAEEQDSEEVGRVCFSSSTSHKWLAVCCPRLLQAQGNTIFTTDCKVRSALFILTNGFFARK